jgi:trypsin-like peptidase
VVSCTAKMDAMKRRQFFFLPQIAAGLLLLGGAHALGQGPLPGGAPPPRPGLATATAPQPDTGAAALVRDYRNGLVFVEGSAGKGSGFVTDIKGKKYLATNAHVLAGVKAPAFKLLDRTPVQVGAGFAAVDHDLVALTVVSGGTAIPAMESFDQNVSIGDDVVVLGNAEGAGVVNLLQGKVVGVGPNLVEVDAPFVPGNSGSPIIHARSGKVIGIATYMLIRNLNAGKQEVRRFGYRLDSVQKWQPIDWRRFYGEADTIDKIEKLTTDLVALVQDVSRHGRVTLAFENPAIRNALGTLNDARTSRASQRDADRAMQSFFSSLRFASQGDVRDAKNRLTYDFFQRRLATEEKDREELYRIFDRALKDTSK